MSGEYPLPAFYFMVVFEDKSISDTSFQEVSGITTNMETDAYHEGGENHSMLHLPTKITQSKLVLKRGITTATSGLVDWCKNVLEGGLYNGIETKSLSVRLLNEKSNPVRVWNFENAYPVNWEIGSLNSTKNEVAIEKIELQYQRVIRELS